MIQRLANRIRHNRDGVSIVEFALISPVLLIALMGAMDAAFNAYTSVMLRGAVAKAARNATIEAADSGALDMAVTARVRQVLPAAQLSYSRKSYSNFSSVGTPEDYNDLNGDGACNAGEPFEDANGNGMWDADRGKNGNGGAREVVEYRVTMSHDRMFPTPTLIGLPPQFTTTAITVLRNQPYEGNDVAPATGNCI